jgi:hypothetical protein
MPSITFERLSFARSTHPLICEFNDRYHRLLAQKHRPVGETAEMIRV